MSQQYPGSWKNCATCVYWIAQRDCDYFGQRVIVDSSMTKGRCAIPYGGWKNQSRTATCTCNDWEKWPVLR